MICFNSFRERISLIYNFDYKKLGEMFVGHKPDAFENQDYLDHIFGGIYWAATAIPANDTKK